MIFHHRWYILLYWEFFIRKNQRPPEMQCVPDGRF